MPVEHIAVLREGEGDEEKLKLVETVKLPGWDKNANLTVVGKPHVRAEGIEKVTGRARYAYDIRLPGQLYAAALRSPYPHARIRRLDTTQAATLPGVHAVLSSANAPAITWYEEECGLFAKTVRFVGDEVAVVAAESEEIAQDALRLIDVDYEPLAFVLDLEAALQPDAPAVHEGGNQTDEPTVYERGDLAQGFQEADVIMEQSYTTQTQVHNSLEPHGCTAFWQGDQLDRKSVV